MLRPLAAALPWLAKLSLDASLHRSCRTAAIIAHLTASSAGPDRKYFKALLAAPTASPASLRTCSGRSLSEKPTPHWRRISFSASTGSVGSGGLIAMISLPHFPTFKSSKPVGRSLHSTASGAAVIRFLGRFRDGEAMNSNCSQPREAPQRWPASEA